MFDEYLKRNDVQKFIEQIKTNERYNEKGFGRFENYSFYISKEISLYIFYDALYLYKIILDDVYLFDEYLIQLEKIYKKLNQYDDIIEGIHKLIGKMVSIQLEIKDVTLRENREKIITHIFNQYIVNGYFIHGFNTSYEEEIRKKPFSPEKYENDYYEFQKINDIFNKYRVSSIITKDFSKEEISFTDDFIMGCYYSHYAPFYYSSFLNNDEIFGKRNRKDGYLIDDYYLSISNLKKYMSSNLFSLEDQKYVLDIVKRKWDSLHKKEKKISLLMVKRRTIVHNSLLLQDYLQDDSDIYDVVDRLLRSKFSHIENKDTISNVDFSIITLEPYYEKKEPEQEFITPEEEYYQYKEKEVTTEFLNVYGKVSIFILLGSIFISLGVLITIIMILKGM